MLIFARNCQTAIQNSCFILHFHQQWMWFSAVLHPHQHLVWTVFQVLAIQIGVVVSHCCFNLHFSYSYPALPGFLVYWMALHNRLAQTLSRSLLPLSLKRIRRRKTNSEILKLKKKNKNKQSKKYWLQFSMVYKLWNLGIS